MRARLSYKCLLGSRTDGRERKREENQSRDKDDAWPCVVLPQPPSCRERRDTNPKDDKGGCEWHFLSFSLSPAPPNMTVRVTIGLSSEFNSHQDRHTVMSYATFPFHR